MASEFDIVIRGGTVMDGNGGTPFVGDVAVRDGKFAEVGKVSGRGAEEINSRGLAVSPGSVDIHTHYDGQAMWNSCLAPSSWHGVSTVDGQLRRRLRPGPQGHAGCGHRAYGRRGGHSWPVPA